MFKKLFIIIFLLISSNAFSQNINLLPKPQELKLTGDKFIINTNLSALIQNKKSDKLINYANEVIRRISTRTGIFLGKEVIFFNSKDYNDKVIIDYKNVVMPQLDNDESYKININKNNIHIQAQSDIGAMRALETLYQLVQNDSINYFFPTLEIIDNPRFAWRGLMIDVSRHFMPVDVIKRNINVMALVKMNVLHLHLSDNQSVRVESKIYPQIQEKCSNGEYFTQEQLKEIINYANSKGIRVIPEFDIPWHTTAWFAAFPELASKEENYTPETDWGVFDPVFNPAIEETYIFFDKFFGEMASIFNDEYFHIGGDEGTDKHWLSNKQITDFMKKHNMKDVQSLHNYFNLRILAILKKYNKKMIGWDEILQPEMPKDILIQSWRGYKSLVEAATNGYNVILSNGYYIDLIQPTDFHYLNDPLPDTSNISDEAKNRILGGEATMWSEVVTLENVDSRIWPRTAAIAERFWSKSSVKDVNDMYARLDFISFLAETVGSAHIKNIDMMIRRLSNNYDSSPLRALLEVVEPLKLYTRHQQGVKYTTYSPYSRVVDAATPDVKQGRILRNLIKEFTNKPTIDLANQIKNYTAKYINNNSHFLTLAKNSPILKEVVPLSNNLYNLCLITNNLIDIKLNNSTLQNNKREEYLKDIKAAYKSYGQVEIVFVKEVEELLSSIK